MRLEAGNGIVRVGLAPGAGGRLASLEVAGLELLRPAGPDPIRWGCYPMAPFAGRVRRGRFRFRGREYALPCRMPPHAIHGTVFDRPFEVLGPGELRCDLGPEWPFRGALHERVSVGARHVRLELVLTAEEPFPASLGWHPWFRRRLERGGSARLHLDAAAMYRRDEEGIPDGTLVPPPPGPWDDCFTGLRTTPVVEWPGALRLRLGSDATCFVVYDEPADALAVEPQTAPPDALNRMPRVVAPGRPLRLGLTLEVEGIDPP